MGKSSSRVAVLGLGRLGTSLARALVDARCSVTGVNSRFLDQHPVAKVEVVRAISELRSRAPYDLALLSIAPENRSRYHGLGDLFRVLHEFAEVTSPAPIAIASGDLTPRQIRQAIGARPYIRFACTCAVAAPDSLCLYDASAAPATFAVLNRLLPRKRWLAVPTESYELHISCLVAAALQCAAMSIYDSLLLSTPATNLAASLRTEITLEAARMIRAQDGDSASAFWLSCTPGGMTETAAGRMFDASLIQSLLGSSPKT